MIEGLSSHIPIQGPKHEKILQRFRDDMLLFGKVCLPHMFSVKSAVFHRELVDNFSDNTIRKLNVVAPRGHSKSSLAACLWPLYHIMFQGDRPKFIVLVSKTEGHAIRLLQTLKDALDYGVELRSAVGYWGQHSAKVWKSTEIVLKDGTMILCRGTGQMVVGLKHGDQRPTLVILDDPEDMNNTKTAEAMEWNLRWLLQSLVPALDPQIGRICIIGTPQHQRCMVETMKVTTGWKTLKYKAEQDDGTALWPEWQPIERLLEEKESLSSIGRVSSYYREYQCEIIGDEDQLFKEAYLRYYAGTLRTDSDGEAELHLTMLDGSANIAQKILPVNVFMGVDPASSTAQTADYSTIVPLAIDVSGNRYLLPYFNQRVTPMVLADNIMAYAKKYPYLKRCRIESVGYQEMLRDYIRSQVYIPGLEIKENPRTSKSNRLETLQPFFAQGKIFLMEDMKALIDQLLMYPRGKNDDLLDGLYYANKGTYVPAHSVLIEEEDKNKHFIFWKEDIRENGWVL
jgi:phage terminase large subunit-like protein